MQELSRKPITRKAPRREHNKGTYTFPPKEIVLLIRPGGTAISTTVGGEEERIQRPRRFTAIDIEMPDGRHISIQDLIENYAG